MTTDKTGAPTTISRHNRHFAIAVDGVPAGMASFVDHDNQRILFHTEVKNQFEGRGLATILITAALTATREDGLRVVPVCPMVAAYVGKHHDFDDIVDPVTPQIEDWLGSRRGR